MGVYFVVLVVLRVLNRLIGVLVWVVLFVWCVFFVWFVWHGWLVGIVWFDWFALCGALVCVE